MAKFSYNNTQNTSTNHTLFELNYGFHLQVLFKENIDSHLRSHSTNKLVKELQELIKIYCQNLLYIKEL